jgi:hypothetical protein
MVTQYVNRIRLTNLVDINAVNHQPTITKVGKLGDHTSATPGEGCRPEGHASSWGSLIDTTISACGYEHIRRGVIVEGVDVEEGGAKAYAVSYATPRLLVDLASADAVLASYCAA